MPNASAGRDADAVAAIAAALAPPGKPGVGLLDVHRDPDHDRSVFTVAGRQGALAPALVRAAQAAVERIDLRRQEGVHPRVGALDVAPIVYTNESTRGAACAEALTAAALIGEDVGVPVFLYGDLATAAERRERSALRAGGPERLAGRLQSGELEPDYGPAELHTSAGATLVTARPPLVAFNLELETRNVEVARRIARRLREADGGLPGVRALGLELAERGRVQVSLNVHDPFAVPLRRIVELVRAEAPVACAELVGLAPRAALEGFPEDVPIRDFDPARKVIENALRSLLDDGEGQGQAAAQAPGDAGGDGRPR